MTKKTKIPTKAYKLKRKRLLYNTNTRVLKVEQIVAILTKRVEELEANKAYYRID